MPPRRKRTHNTQPIANKSSSDTEASEASEDSAPRFDADRASKERGHVAGHDMSERQTRKINSGKFGMFNHPTLTIHAPRTPDSGKKRKRVEEYNDYSHLSSSRRSGRRVPETCEPVDMTGDDEDDLGLFVREDDSQSNTVEKEHEPGNDAGLYGNMTPARIQKVKEYLSTLELVEKVDSNLETTETELSRAMTEQTALWDKLATFDATADDRFAEIIHERDEAIKIANKIADSKIKDLREQLPLKKAKYTEEMSECNQYVAAKEELVKKAKAEVVTAKTTKSELERQGGFELCSDVRDVQARMK